MPEKSLNDTNPTPSTSTPDTTPGPTPASATVSNMTRPEWDAELEASQGPEWMRVTRRRLDEEWEYMVQTFGD